MQFERFLTAIYSRRSTMLNTLAGVAAGACILIPSRSCEFAVNCSLSGACKLNFWKVAQIVDFVTVFLDPFAQNGVVHV